MRVGLFVPRFRHSAVARNQLKRRLRELSRLRLLPSCLAVDVVMRVRPDAYDATFEQLRADVDRVLTQLLRGRDAATSAPAAPSSPS